MSEPNPYQSPQIPAESPAPSRRPGEDALYFAAQCQNIIGGLGLLFLIVGLVDWMYVILSTRIDKPVAPIVVMGAFMVIQCSLMLAGGISMHQHKRRWLAIAGAWAGILPFCGCYFFSLISGIWALMVLHRPEVKALFAEDAPFDSE
ncbi:MAG: hypothetical protein K8R36_23420 [Planctomycetales bacterium]|nr:hypothetical protein [Planctomycetales bacterium]